MTRSMRILLVPVLLALPLVGCATVGPDINFDPTEWFAGELFNSKKPLPGERKAVFPEGVPGVGRGVPPELMRGQPPGVEAAGFPPGGETEIAPAAPKTKAKAKPKPAVAKSAPTRIVVPRAEPAGDDPPAAARRAPGWPDPPPAAPARRETPWPDPPAAPRGGAPGGGVAWPDPPPMR